ncbi:MAG TPA: hypothetical protein PLA69_03105, partial [Flavobacterium sp.]|nr:hypothetical protein [Flavobacterium sp.]
MKPILTFLTLFLSFFASSQHKVSGRVTDAAQKPVSGVNVFIDGTYDGGATAADGSFEF